MKPFDKFKRDFQGKRVLILGIGTLGRGVDVARVFAQIGCRVTASDLKPEKILKPSLVRLRGLPITYRLGEHRKEDVLNSEVVIRNPAVPIDNPLLKLSREKRIPVLMDTGLFARYFPGTMIGVTGTRGKTTTTILIYELIKSAKAAKVFLAGNSTTKANIALLEKAASDQIAVMELSSWELQGFRELAESPDIAVVTNIYPDHLDRYKSMEEYVADKEAIFAFQKKTDKLLLNRKNAWTKKMAKRAPAKVVWFSKEDFPSDWSLPLIGDHNRENAAAALKVGRLLAIGKEQMQSVFAGFKGVTHRLETVAKINGISFINDTTSTTPTATIKALRAISSPAMLLVGGNSKNLPLNQLAREIAQRAKKTFLLKGSGTADLKRKLKRYKKVVITKQNLSFKETVEAAAKAAQPGDVVLLSPGFTSYGEFNNEFERGEAFRKIVKRMKKGKQV